MAEEEEQVQVHIEAMKPSMYNELKDAFDLFDANGDGYIAGSELGTILRVLGQNPTEEMIEAVLKKADKNGDQVITLNEYLTLLQDNLKDPIEVEIELREAFRIFDKNRDGTLNVGELKQALLYCGEGLSQQEVKEFCDLMDSNSDGKVDVDEFVKFMCKRY